MDPDVEGLARLRHDALVATGFYPGGPAALAYHRDRIAEWLAVGPHWRVGPVGAPEGFVVRFPERDPPTHLPTTHVLISRRPGSPTAAWVADVLPAALDGVPDAEVQALVPAWDREVRAILVGRGLSVAKVDLAGRVDVAVARFVARWGDVAPLPARDATSADAAAILDLCREVFEAEPAYGAHYAEPAFRAAEQARLAAGLPAGLNRVVEVAGRIRGFYQASLQVPNVHHGSSAGINLVFAEELRGARASIRAYGEILPFLARAGIGWIKGATARPPVMHVARVLGRGVTGVTMRRDANFPPGWFDAVLG